MAKMAVTYVAYHFGTDHAMPFIDHFFDVGWINWFKITWPATARIKFRIGGKKRCTTANAAINTSRPVIPESTREGTFGPFLPGNVEFLTAQLFFPVSVGFDNFSHRWGWSAIFKKGSGA